jgi:hypothetical protein
MEGHMHHTLGRALAISARFSLISALVLAVTLIAPPQRAAAAGAGNDHTVLILGTTVSGGASSREALAAAAIGMTIEIATATTWAAKSTADFSTYRAIILGDQTCTSLSAAAPAIANTAVWGPAVNGRVVIDGTDPVFHSDSGGSQWTTGAVQFAAGETTRTGSYVSLSCYYHGTAEHTPVPLLDAFVVGGFTVRGVGCFNDAHIVATHPALAGITDATLSNWGCSVHEAFDLWPVASFDVLAIARGIGSTFTASDGSVGTPYILARGVSVISDITLAPPTGTAAVGTNYTLTATVNEGGTATAGKMVTFTAIGGPNIGMTAVSGPTNASGQTTMTYSSALEGTDTWVARFIDAAARTQTSNRATVEWTRATGPVLHSLALNGTTAYAEAPDAAKLNLTGDWTVETWFKDETAGGYNHPFAKLVAKADRTASPEVTYMIVIGNNVLRAGVQHNNVSIYAEADLTTTTANAWHHVAAAFTRSTANLKVYLDGVQVAEQTLGVLSDGNTVPVGMGRGGTGGYYFTGKLDDVRIWNTSRTASEIAANMAAEFSSAPAGLIANWKFDEATGTTAADSTPAPDNATLNGGATFSTDVHP